MTTIKTICTSENITIEEARILFNSIGMTYIRNEHNNKMMKIVIDEFLTDLRKSN
jgi:hypothetical protein